MNITKFSLRQPVLVNLLTVLIIVAGLISWIKMPREIFPTIDRHAVTITTTYLGVAPGEIEELVTIPLERSIATVDGVEKITATSRENVSVIQIELEDDIQNASQVVMDIQTAVARVKELPTDAEDPLVRADKMNMPMLWISVGAKIPERELRKLATELKTDLEEIKGVSEVVLFGVRKPQITVEVDPDRLASRQLSITQVMAAINRKHVNVPGGRLYGKRGEYLIRTVGRFQGAEAVRGIVVRANPSGTVTVGDVARVTESFEDATEESRVNGKPAAFIMVYRRTDADAIRVTKKILEYLKQNKDRYPETAVVSVLWDSTKAIERRQDTLYQNGVMGLLLVIVLLFIFLDWRMALMTSLGIPVAFFGAFILMRAFGLTLNMMSMFALIMVLGMLVDDAVVVVENFYRHLMMGKSRLEAALVGCSQVIWPVIAAVTTTVVAFLVLIRLPGPMGKIMAILPMVVSAALLVSLIEALFILPSHLKEFSRPIRGVQEPGRKEAELMLAAETPLPVAHHLNGREGASHEARWFLAFQAGFRWLLLRVTRWWYVALPLLVVGFLALAVVSAAGNKFIPFPSTTIERFNLGVELSSGTKLAETSKALRKLEALIARYPKSAVESYICRAGQQSLGRGRVNVGTHLGTCTVLMARDGKGPKGALAVLRELRPQVARIPGIEKTGVSFDRAGPPAGNPIEVQVRGDRERDIMAVVESIIGKARTIRGVSDVTHDMDDGKRELHVVVDEQAAARYGLDVFTIGTAVRNAFGGGVAAKLQRGEDEIEVVVRLPDRLRHEAREVEALLIQSPRGGAVPFKAVARLKERIGPASLVRVDRKRTVTVYGQVDDQVITAQEANNALRAHVADFGEKHPGVAIKFAGEQERSEEIMGGLKEAGLLALLAIYLILATVFRSFSQPLIIMLGSIPFALVGVVVGLRIHGMHLSIIAVLGFVGLMGIVVNDSLVLVDFVNKARDEGMSLPEAVVDAGVKRLRPVLLTSTTTIAGLLPLAMGWFGAEEFLQPMAVVIVWGLVFSTVLILLMVPCIVLFNDVLWRALTWPFRAAGRLLSRPEPESESTSGEVR
ncbi:MAG: efflux RND transporter permease subunit [bacterium]